MPTVLVVDDDEILRDLVQEFLMTSGYTVISCGTGREALQKIGLLRFDAILLDRQLENENGIDVLKKYRNDGGTALVLMLTGSSSISQKDEALAAGANMYMRKPFKLNELSETLNHMFASRSDHG
jgi:DNA-binding response OmpR family regulator